MNDEAYKKQRENILEHLKAMGIEGCTLDLVSIRNPSGDVEKAPISVLDSYLYHLQGQDAKDKDKASQRPHSHYYKDVSNIDTLDVYRLIKLFEVTDPCAQHILKKCLVQGGRGAKDAKADMENIRDTANRWLDMHKEDGNAPQS